MLPHNLQSFCKHFRLFVRNQMDFRLPRCLTMPIESHITCPSLVC